MGIHLPPGGPGKMSLRSLADLHATCPQVCETLRRKRMPRIVNVALLLSISVGMGAQAADRDQTKAVKISDSIYMATTTGNVYLVTTPAGNVVIDTALAAQVRTPEKS